MIKYKYKIKAGDIIVNKPMRLVGIVTRKTSQFTYYTLDSMGNLRIRTSKLWESIDKGRLDLGYSSLKHRRKKKKGRRLDLHGTKHIEAPEKIRQYLNWAEIPTRIITGSSNRMKDIVRKISIEYDYRPEDDPANPGCIIIFEK